MKLIAVVVFGYLAIAGSDASSAAHHHSHKKHNDNIQEHSNEQQNYGSSQYQGQGSLESTHQRDNKNSGDKTFYNSNQQVNQGQNDEFSGSNWNVQTSNSQNRNTQDRQYGQEGQNYNSYDGQMRKSQNGGLIGEQSSEELYQQQSYNGRQNYGSFSDFNSESSESNSQEDYIKEQNDEDVAYEIGRKVAQKMVKFFNIIEKYAARNGTVQTNEAQERLSLRQWALPLDHHQFLNMVDNKVNGLSRGIIKAMYINTERNNIDLEYFFNSLLVDGKLKASMGPKGSFNFKMTNTNVNVSTELQNRNRNRNYAHSNNGETELSYQNVQDLTDNQSINENMQSKYVQFINRAIENEMIDNSYNGLVGCLRSEIESTFDMPTHTKKLTIENKKTQLIVSLEKTQQWRDDQATSKQRKVQFVAFRQNKYENGGYKLKVKIVLAKQPSWESDVIAQKGNKQINIKNVNFHAQDIVATAILERVPQQNGLYRFNVEDASVKLEGLRFDIGKFENTKNNNEMFAREIGQNLPKIIENGMSAALQQQLYHQQQICQQSPMDCFRCNQINY